MVVSELIPEAFRAATGKLPTFTTGSTKWTNLLASANFYSRAWARERNVQWNSLRDPDYTLGTVTATNSFDLDEEVISISRQEDDFVRITHTTANQYTDYDLVEATRLLSYPNGSYAAQFGRSLRFNSAFTSSSQQFGGTIFVPAYLMPDPLVRSSDEVWVDDPNWLILVVAADYVRNDVTRKDLRADLIAEANEAMQAMKEDNDAQVSEPLRSWNPTSHTNDDWMSS